ncbi:ParM/StbA family protein [Halalkalibacter alkalisediminis]|uniref:Actin-like protein N-terminal domain-containing protein n=1 Tax=Halalkalibacter alkalisediminis TaxID=935616 RepID=A0ABV6NJ40_9BACI|nr:ParM/StbA family protein [Halalkalibacter alkalisediminis]
MKMTRFASVDIGNDGLKGYFGSLQEKIHIPNVIAKENEEREIIELEKNTLNGLHVTVESPSLSKNGTYVVGNLATRYVDNERMGTHSVKAESDQSLLVLLTALAVDATKKFSERNSVIKANYLLSTGLPLDEVKAKKRKVLKERLVNSTHKITFLQTPKLQGKTVIIEFADVLVNGEGVSAFLDLTTDDKLHSKNEELHNQCVMINDIGGISTDTAVILTGGEIDNTASKGIDEGTLTYLEEISESIYKELHIKLKSLKHVVDIIKSGKTVSVKGKRIPVHHIIDPILRRAAKTQMKHIESVWEKAPEVEKSIQIGGGAMILREYMEELNKEKQYPILFIDTTDDDEEAIWMIARAYWKALQLYVKHKNLQVVSV